jgi:ADP-heptose:LPS heptosyltransferase
VESQLNTGRGGSREKILVLFPGAPGDFICFLPALELLARNHSVDLLARTEYADLVAPGIYASSIERREIGRLFIAHAGRDEALRRFFAPYLSIYSWTGSGDRSFASNLALLAGGKAKLFPFRPLDPAVHISDYYLDCVGGKLGRETYPTIPLRRNALFWARNWLGERGFEREKILALAPGSGAREKNWPTQYFRQVERWWQGKGGVSFVIFGPAEEERFEKDRDWSGATVARGMDLKNVAALLSLCDVFLGNDSGLTHLAASVGVETVALFGPTDPGAWAPRGRRVTVVSRNVACAPCERETMKSCPHRQCLTTITPTAAIDILGHFLRRDAEIPPRGTLLDKGVGRH